MIDLLVIGGAGVDSTVQVPALPLPDADTHPVPPIIDRIGNTGAGVALGAAALGLSVRFADLIGEDPQGELIRARLSGLDFAWAPAAAGTRRSVLLVDPAGRRTSLHDPRPTPGERLPRDLYAVPARHAHVSIMDFARHVYADLDGVPTSTDLHDWDGVNPYHLDFARESDLVFLSATALGDPEAAMRAILGLGRAGLVVCTRGADGCLVLARGGAVRAFPAAPLPGPVLDTNGAGDAFVSGFLYGRLRGASVEQCVRYGALAGAHACTSAGTHEQPITEPELLKRATA
ncbi:PfkB family carbohydrate kinase [Nonomuraea sp. NPDC050328]|uniref:PfkB family carbohydrate kinase n=1 Tax=Nonomuraea sp. NPDC050328 TaxID=3364361 RepID=UPI0037B1EA5D